MLLLLMINKLSYGLLLCCYYYGCSMSLFHPASGDKT